MPPSGAAPGVPIVAGTDGYVMDGDALRAAAGFSGMPR
jgi:hypothetical protein